MIALSTGEATSSEILAAAKLAAGFPVLSRSTEITEFDPTGPYSRITAIPLSDAPAETALAIDVPLLPHDPRTGASAASPFFHLVYRSVPSMLGVSTGATEGGSWDVSVQPADSSSSPRQLGKVFAGTERFLPVDTSLALAVKYETAGGLASHPTPIVSSDSLHAEMDRWLRDLRNDARGELATKALYRMELENWLQSLEAEGQRDLSDRLALLRSVSDEDDDGDMPLSDEATLGFMDFIADVQFDGIRRSLTSVHGWLCTEWTYSDNRLLVLWFKNRVGTMVTAFGSDGNLMTHIGRNLATNSRIGATNILVDEGFFSWRPQNCN